MVQELFRVELEEFRKEICGYRMENGEFRFRLSSEDSAYIRTEVQDSVWQESHMHSFQYEHYLVENGSIILAIMLDDKASFTKYNAGDYFFVPPKTPHNIFASEGGIFHTVKFGGKADRIPFLKLDEIIKKKYSSFSNDIFM